MSRKTRINYYVVPDPASLARRAAQYFAEMIGEAVDARGRARVAISGGSTPKAAFGLLVDPAQPWRARVPWDKIELYWVDERCVGPDDAESNYRMTREAMLDQAPIPASQVHRMEGELVPEEAGGPLRISAEEQLSPGRRGRSRVSTLWRWAWGRTATRLRCFPIARPFTRWGVW